MSQYEMGRYVQMMHTKYRINQIIQIYLYLTNTYNIARSTTTSHHRDGLDMYLTMVCVLGVNHNDPVEVIIQSQSFPNKVN